ncbi:MAG: hypothetical protein R3E79_11400 [Caldilineaceae bacterium]
MNTLPYSARPFHHRGLTSAVIVIGLLLFGAWPILWLATQLKIGVMMTALAPLGIWNFLVNWLLLGQPVSYGLISVGVLALSIRELFYKRPPWWQRLLLLIVIVATLGFMFVPYQPAVQPASGYSLVVVTKPRPWLNGLARAQAVGEQKDCTYTVLGWQTASLFYTAQCGSTQAVTWRFTVGEMTRPIRYEGALPTLVQMPLSQPETWETVQAFAGYPPDVDLRGLYVRKPGLRSPDGKWTALVAEYLYSREDIVLVSKQ